MPWALGISVLGCGRHTLQGRARCYWSPCAASQGMLCQLQESAEKNPEKLFLPVFLQCPPLTKFNTEPDSTEERTSGSSSTTCACGDQRSTLGVPLYCPPPFLFFFFLIQDLSYNLKFTDSVRPARQQTSTISLLRLSPAKPTRYPRTQHL